MSTQIRVRRGLVADLPAAAASGEPLFATDGGSSGTLYIGDGVSPAKVVMSGDLINADVNASAAIAYSKLNLSTSIVNADVAAAAAIARSKIAAGTASHVVINDGSGNLSSVAALTVANGGTGLATLTSANLIVGAGASNVTFIAPGTSGNVLTSNGSTWASSAPSSGLNCASVGTAQTITNTTLTASTALTFSPTWGATTKYAMWGTLFFSCANATPDADFQFQGPTVTTVNIGYTIFRDGGTSIVAQDTITAFATGGTAGTTVNMTAGVVHRVVFAGSWITTGSPGSNPFRLEFAQNVNDGGNPTSLLVGSHLAYMQTV